MSVNPETVTQETVNPASVAPAGGEGEKCGCGNAVGSPFVSPKAQYTFFGWILVLMGISHPPVKVVFSCDNCGRGLKTVTDKRLLREHTYR